MLPAVVKRHKILVIGILLIMLIVLVSRVLPGGQLEKVQAEANNGTDMRSLLQRLNSEIVEQKQGELTFQFVSSIGGSVNELTIPGGDATDALRFQITEIGDSYFCVNQNLGGRYMVYCIPFTNVASLTYTE